MTWTTIDASPTGSKWVLMWMNGPTMDASPTGSKWVCGSMGQPWMQVRLDSSGCVDEWEDNGCKSTGCRWVCGSHGEQWMQVRMDVSGSVDEWKNKGCISGLPLTQGLSPPIIPGRMAAGSLCVGRLIKQITLARGQPKQRRSSQTLWQHLGRATFIMALRRAVPRCRPTPPRWSC